MKINFDIMSNDLPGAILLIVGVAASFTAEKVAQKFISDEKRPKFVMWLKLASFALAIAGTLLVIF